MPTENHIIIDKGVSLHPETNTGQVYDYANDKWLDKTIEELQSKPSTWSELEGKPTSFPPSPHTHTVSQITDFPDPYELPTASATVLGGIKPDGTTITVDPVTGIASSSSTQIEDASTSQKGIVQLNDNLNSTSVTQAATPNAIKKVNDKIEGTAWTVIPLAAIFEVDGIGLSYKVKNGTVTIRFRFTNNTPLTANVRYSLGEVGTNYYPSQIVPSNLLAVTGSTESLQQVDIRPSGEINLKPSAAIPVNSSFQGQIIYEL